MRGGGLGGKGELGSCAVEVSQHAAYPFRRLTQAVSHGRGDHGLLVLRQPFMRQQLVLDLFVYPYSVCGPGKGEVGIILRHQTSRTAVRSESMFSGPVVLRAKRERDEKAFSMASQEKLKGELRRFSKTDIFRETKAIAAVGE